MVSRSAFLLAAVVGGFALVAATQAAATTVLDANFDSSTEGFSYSDDTFRATAQPDYASGVWDQFLGVGGSGAITVALGGVDELTVVGMSGGWSGSFTVGVAEELELTLRYSLTQSGDYEATEKSQVIVALDGTQLGGLGGDYADEIRGDGIGGSSITTGWGYYVVNLGTLQPGTYDLTLGSYNSQKTLSSEQTDVLIDDVKVASPAGVSVIDGDCLVPDADLDALLAIDPVNGDRRLVSGDGRGSGGHLAFPRAVDFEMNGQIIVVDSGLKAVLRVDPVTGDRTVVSDAVTGTGPLLDTPYDVQIEPDGTLIVSDVSEILLDPAIFAIDPTTGDRTIISSAAVGTGETLVRPSDLHLDTNGDVLVADGNGGSPPDTLLRVDRTTGDRSYVSQTLVGTGPDFSDLSGVTLGGTGEIYVTDVTLKAVFEVDPLTGDRTIIADPTTGTGAAIGQYLSIDTETDGDLIVVDVPLKNVASINPATLDRTVVSGMGVGGGPLFRDPRDVSIAPTCFGAGGDTDGDLLCDDVDPCMFFANTPGAADTNLDGIPDECQCADANGDGIISSTDLVPMNLCASNNSLCDQSLVDANGDGITSSTDLVPTNLVASGAPAYNLTCERRPEGTPPPQP
jgi:hypothetical protein